MQHTFIADTLPSIAVAFDYAANNLEADVNLTKDEVFALFHDWTLDCQADGTGLTHKHIMAHLKTLDLGYGYSVGGHTFPLRGTAVGQMPTLTEVLAANNSGQLLITFKSNRSVEGPALAGHLANETTGDQVFVVYGGE